MHEIEVKILDIIPSEIKKVLKKIGARKVFEGAIEARFYDFPDGRIKKAGNHLRLRKFGKEKIELTFKRLVSRKKYKQNEETDIIVEDFNAMDSLLKSLGLTKVRDYKKKRTRYKAGNFQYEIDKYPKIPAFVEIEVKSSNASKAKKQLEKAVRLIGYSMKDTKPWDGFEVSRHYGVRL